MESARYGIEQSLLNLHRKTLADELTLINAKANASNIGTEADRTELQIQALQKQHVLDMTPKIFGPNMFMEHPNRVLEDQAFEVQVDNLQKHLEDLKNATEQNTDATEKNTATLPGVLSSLYRGGGVSGLGFADGGMVPANTNFMFAEHSPSGPQFGRTGSAPLFVTPGSPSGGAGTTINLGGVHVYVPQGSSIDPNDVGFRQAMGRAANDMATLLDKRLKRG